MRRLLPAILLACSPLNAGAQAPCETGPISYVFVDNHSIFDAEDPELDSRFRWLYRTANALHTRTRVPVIRRELLFREGDCLDPALLEESERLLRGFDFISRVDVFALRQPDGTYHVLVDTQDEWSTRVDLRVRMDDGLRFEGFKVEEENLAGRGVTVGVFYIERRATRDYGFTFYTPQLARSRWDLSASAGQTRSGTFVREQVAYPFVGEVGRWAARQALERDDRFFDFVAEDREDLETHVLVPTRESMVDLGLVARFGRPGALMLVGGAVAFHDLSYPGTVEAVDGRDYDARRPAGPAASREVARQTEELESLRLFLLLGRRGVRWVKRSGYDTMRGQQDVRLGWEAVASMGRSIPALAADDDAHTSFALKGSVEAGSLLTAVSLRSELRRDLDAEPGREAWEDLLSEGTLQAYWRPRAWPRQTVVVRAALAGGWHTRTPFQLTLGGGRGVRAYGPEAFPGGRRAVFSLEDRVYFGWPLSRLLDLGGTAFVDVGRVWPGDAPFGRDSGWRAAAGVGLRAAKSRGRTVYRADIAFPLDGDASRGRFRLTLSAGETLGLSSLFGGSQFGRIHTGGVSGDLFVFPN